MQSFVKNNLNKLVLFCLLLLCPGVASADQKVTLQLPWHHQFQFAGYYMAKELGYYQAAGLEVEIKPVGKIGNTVKAVLSGAADFGISGSGLLVERSLGKPIVAVATILQQSPTVFLSLESSKIRWPEDLIGKKVMLSPGYQSLPLLALLHKRQLNHKVIKLKSSFNLDSLFSGETDAFNAYRSNEPFLAKSLGQPVNIIDPHDFGIHFYGDTLFTTQQQIQAQPEMVESFRLASIKGWQYALQNPGEVFELLKSAYRVEKSLAALAFEAANITQNIKKAQLPIGHTDLGKWAQMAHHLIAIGQIDSSFRLERDFIYHPPEKLDWSRLAPWVIAILLVVTSLLILLNWVARANIKARKALRTVAEGELRYRRLVERVPGLIYTVSPSTGGAVCYSPHVQSVLGYPADYLAEHPSLWHDSIHPDDVTKVDQTLAEIEINKTHYLEYRIEDKEGDWHWFSDCFIKRIDPLLGPVVDGLATDITEQKQARQMQQLADQQLRDALNAVSDGIWDWNVQSGESTLDSRSKEFFGLDGGKDYTSEEIFQHVDADDIPQIKKAIEAHISGQADRFDHTFRVHRPDGTIRWVRGRGRIIDRDSSGNALRIIGTNTDITEQMLAEQKRQESEQRFSDLIEKVAGISIQGYDEERRVIFWNRSSELLYGYRAEEALGRRLEELIIPEPMHEQVLELTRAWIEEGREIPAGEHVLRDKQGQDVPVFSSHIMRESSSGKELFCIDVDLRPLKDAEAQRQELEDQLRQRYKMEAIGTMAGGIAHDFNNHLAIILGNIELAALKLSAESPVAGYIQHAKTAANRSKELVKQILIYGRRNPQTLKPIRIAMVLEETLKLLRPTIPSSVAINCSIANSVEQKLVAADSTQLQQILINLCSNAVHAMDEKGCLQIALDPVQLSPAELTAHENLAAGQYLRLSVADDGKGMPAEVLEKIFDPFFTTKDVDQGTGMGLSVVHGIVESHGGFISVDSTVGKGSCFQIYFPLTDRVASDETAATGSLPTGSERVLLLDDEEVLVELGAEILSEHGYQVTTATSSTQVLEMFKAAPDRFDLLISDQTMPELSGTELAEQLLQIRPNLPIILCTGYSAKVTPEKAKLIGIRKFCMKPLNLPRLVKITREVLDQQKEEKL